ncbi:MAG: hypothetical protein JSW47_02090 [Phycisphaerales bacterium]|nr:MAG: hypothetical protein JSW47_02090 [Phycisphaerales bacterium]
MKKPLGDDREVLTIDFIPGEILRYRFVSSRDIVIGWDAPQATPRPGARASDKSCESMEVVMIYKPVDVDLYGLTTIEAVCESVKVSRSKGPRRDAVQSLAGRTFTLTVGPTGRIEDYSQLDKLLKEIGEKAFSTDTSKGRIKEPEMIGDFVASQWFLWDSTSSIEKPSKGVKVGQSWKSKLSVPTPMVMREARDVTYTLDEIRPGEKGRLAVITSSYKAADSVPQGWPIPYWGSFQMKGAFGFYRNYRVLSLQGDGEEIFNIEAGRTERCNQQYELRLSASLLLPLPGANPRITINQKLTMELLED